MFYNEAIEKGISYLKNSQNSDGGIPIGKLGDASGYWTTAESIEAILSTDYFQLTADNMRFVLQMVRFLLDGFKPDSIGGYWEGRVGSGASTMTTGHVVFALTLYVNKFIDYNINVQIDTESALVCLGELRNEIQEVINKAETWLLSTQNSDGGWGPTKGTNTNMVCCYYVLKGLSMVGKNSESDNKAYSACLLIRKKIQTVLKKRQNNLSGDDFASLLYGYMSLMLCKFFRKYDKELEHRINQFIKKNWRRLQQSASTEELASASKSFLNSLPWITLNALLSTENYVYTRKLDKLLQVYCELQAPNGSWCVVKNSEEHTTWITAEIVIDFNLAQTRYLKYQNDIIFVKKFKTVVFSNVVLCFICLLSIMGYTWNCLSGSTTWYDYIWNYIITTLGIASSIVTIITIKFNE